MLTFDAVPAKLGDPETQFTCPGCGAVRSVPRAIDARVRAESLKVRRA
jgi:transcription elongation factor Elf1